MILHVLKHPDERTLAQCIEITDGAHPPSGYEAMTVAEFTTWEAAEIANGWSPPPLPPPPAPVPEAITNAQCRVVLVRQGINPDDVLAYINSAPLPTEAARQELKARWEYANHIYRSDPATIQLGGILGFTSEQMDDLFRAGASIP